MEYCISTKQLTKRYGTEISVNKLSLSVPQGCVYGFLGPNGAGKTTTMKMILGLVHPSEGSLSIFGEETTDKNRLRILQNIGSLIESPSYYGHLTATENLEIVCLLRGIPKAEIKAALSAVRLPAQSKKVVSKFSLGMKQRLGIATALLGNPKLLLLDEPTNGLDPAGIQEMRELVKSLPGRYGMTVFVSSHLLSEIDQIADEVAIISHGKLVFQDTLQGLHDKSSKHLVLRTTDNQKVISILADAKADGDWIILPRLSDEDTAKISILLARQNIGMIRMEQRETSLEDIFLSMTSPKGEVTSL